MAKQQTLYDLYANAKLLVLLSKLYETCVLLQSVVRWTDHPDKWVDMTKAADWDVVIITTGPEVTKKFVLNSTEHEISTSHKN